MKLNRLPTPGSLVTLALPPCASTMPLVNLHTVRTQAEQIRAKCNAYTRAVLVARQLGAAG